jgi:hypothetical protein
LQPRSQHHMFCQHEGLLERGLLEERGERREEMRPGHEKKKQTNPGESHVMLTALQQLLTSKRGERTMHGAIFYQHGDPHFCSGCMPDFLSDQSLLATSTASARPGCIHRRTVHVVNRLCTQSGPWQDVSLAAEQSLAEAIPTFCGDGVALVAGRLKKVFLLHRVAAAIARRCTIMSPLTFGLHPPAVSPRHTAGAPPGLRRDGDGAMAFRGPRSQVTHKRRPRQVGNSRRISHQEDL